jgi:general secretion pathway protein J
MKRRASGFTLIELVIAMTLLAGMLALLYSGLSFAVRGWDTRDAHARRIVDQRISENFLRRELSEIFPMRWKDPSFIKFAFKGERDKLQFVSSRPAGYSVGGLSLVGLEVVPHATGRGRDLVMRRALPDDDAKDFRPLEAAKPVLLLEGVDEVKFSYFGADSDVNTPQWSDEWSVAAKMPMLVRMSVRMADGRAVPDMLARVVIAEEAGCLESTFQRGCRPRRPT